ncbi:hypothetical protein ABZW30_34175 [Kitasatospora sp. NPDC004669]
MCSPPSPGVLGGAPPAPGRPDALPADLPHFTRVALRMATD